MNGLDLYLQKIMTSREETTIKEWSRTLNSEIIIGLTLTLDERSRAFQDFCKQLSRLVPKVRIKTQDESDSAFPEIRIENVRYRAIPSGKELMPFLALFSSKSDRIRNLPDSISKQLATMEIPALLKIYVTPHCPFCPVTVQQLLMLAAANTLVRLTVIDGALFPESAQSDNVQSAPTVILDNQFRWTGSIDIEEVVDMILNRDPSRLSAASLRDMFNDGNALRVAHMMLDSGKLIPAFLELLVHDKWPVRLAAMVAFETLAEKNTILAAQVNEFLWETFPGAEDTVKGDILFLMGKSGDTDIIPKLETILTGDYPEDLKEAAGEALAELTAG